MKSLYIIASIALALLLIAALVMYYIERVKRKEYQRRAAFNAKSAGEWHQLSKDLTAIAEAQVPRVKHIETGNLYTVYGQRVVDNFNPLMIGREEHNTHLELLVFMYGEFTYLEASWFVPVDYEEAKT